MADVQKYFIDFHDVIKLGRFDENEDLRNKRDVIIGKLEDGLDEVFAALDQDTPTFTWFSQGSYDLDTGIKPAKDGDFDIDVGIVFDVCKDDHADPVAVKEWVYDALFLYSDEEPKMRRSCVTVFYHEDEEDSYHVDLAVYSAAERNLDSCQYIAKGKQNSIPEYRVWEQSDPQGLASLIKNKHADGDAAQFRRIIRYLKRWKDTKFTSEGNAAPTGIAITIAAYNWFFPDYQMDLLANTKNYRDLSALRQLVNAVIAQFIGTYKDNELIERLTLTLPVAPYCDLLEKMTDNQMKQLKDKLITHRDALDSALNEVAPEDACKTLQQQFDDFPVPEKKDTARATVQGIAGSSISA